MKYFICINGKLKEASEGAYEVWYEEEGANYELSAFSVHFGDTLYTVETLYVGACEDFEDPLPFTLYWFKDRMIDQRRSRRKSEVYDIEQFASWDEMQERYHYLLKKIDYKAGRMK